MSAHTYPALVGVASIPLLALPDSYRLVTPLPFSQGSSVDTSSSSTARCHSLLLTLGNNGCLGSMHANFLSVSCKLSFALSYGGRGRGCPGLTALTVFNKSTHSSSSPWFSSLSLASFPKTQFCYLLNNSATLSGCHSCTYQIPLSILTFNYLKTLYYKLSTFFLSQESHFFLFLKKL